MAEQNPDSHKAIKEAYLMLGLKTGATFDEIQQARKKKLDEMGEDPILKAKIESCYDSLLMESLKARQLGKVSNAAINASKKEKSKNEIGGGLGSSLLTRINKLDFSDSTDKGIIPSISNSQGFTIRIALGLLALLILLISPDQSIQIILSLSTIGLFLSQVKRGRGLFQSLGWSVVFLSIGLILGGLIVSGFVQMTDHPNSFSSDKFEALVALISIWIASLLF